MTFAAAYFFFTQTSTSEFYTLSLHDALPIYGHAVQHAAILALELQRDLGAVLDRGDLLAQRPPGQRSEEHTSELQSHVNLVCRLLLEKKNSTPTISASYTSTTQPLSLTFTTI